MAVPPMVYFDKRFQAQKTKSEIALAALKSASATTQSIYYAFLHNAQLGPSLMAHSRESQKASAIRIATWASHNLFDQTIYSLESRDLMRKLDAPARIFHILECFYHALLFSWFYLPKGDEDAIISSILDNTSWLETGAWQDERMVRVEPAVTRSYLGGHPDKPCDLHEVTFADAAIFHVAEHKGRLQFMGGGEGRAPITALAAAIQKILAANNAVGKIRAFLNNHDASGDDVLEALIAKVIENIRGIHRNDPMALITADQINIWAGSIRKDILATAPSEMDDAS